MEAIGIGLIVAVGIVSTLFYSVAAHSLAVIARKTDQGNTMEILAWIPLLQIIPALAVGGSSLGGFLLGSIGLVVANIALFLTSQFLGGGLGGLLYGAGVTISTLVCLVYFARISWNTAVARELPGWFGLLVAVPGISFFIYPVMAFHDGWVHPHKVGLVVALAVALVSAAPLPALMQQIESQGGITMVSSGWSGAEEAVDIGHLDAMETGMALADPSTPGNVPAEMPTPVARDHDKSIRALLDLQGRFETLDALTAPENMYDPDNRVRALGLIRSIRGDLEARRADLEADTYADLAEHLVRVEALAQGRSGGSSGRIQIADSNRAAGAADSDVPAAPASFDKGNVPPTRPFPVIASDACPRGAEIRSRARESGEEEWCQQLDQYGGLRHGWYARYFEGGQPEQVGEYREGLRVGIWTRFYPSGEVRAQAEFEDGLQHGWLLSFDTTGQRKKAVRFEEGTAVR